MRCLWRLFKWPKRLKSENEERQHPLETLDRITLLESLQGSRHSEAQHGGNAYGLQERYVRFGIGGAGNTRKSCFPFLKTLQ